MNELADKMAKIAVLALMKIIGAIAILCAAWALWLAWAWATPQLFTDWPESITSPGFLPFAAAFVVLSLAGYGWRR